MAGDVVQAQYEQLDEIAQRFDRQAEATQQMTEQVRRAMSALQQGGWIGKGVEAFVSEMERDVLPGLRRLESGLVEGGKTTQRISQTIRQAEEEAAQPFLQSGSSSNESPPSSNRENTTDSHSGQRDDATSPAERAWQLSHPTHLVDLVKETPRGAGNPRLNRAMEQLLNTSSDLERERLLKEIASIRGRRFEAIQSDYEKYLRLRNEQRESVKDLDLLLYPNHLGSDKSLRFGNIVGKALGIDPVFGAMLNPTGGLMGPNNAAIRVGAMGDSIFYVGLRQPTEGAPLSNHSISHDAFGYLLGKHGIGPGFDYLGRESHRNPLDPMTGQVSGIKFWKDQSRSIPERIHTAIGENAMRYMLVPGSDFWQGAKRLVGDVPDQVVNVVDYLL